MHPALSLIAQITRTDPESLSPDLTLARLGLHSSLGLGILRSALERRFQRKLGPFTWQTTIAQLLAELDGAAPASSPSAASAGFPENKKPAGGIPSPASGPFGGRTRSPFSAAAPAIGHGVDIQEIGAMPDPAGGRADDPFYAAHFTASELAGAEGRADSKAHLCGLWCAKEAIRKSDPELTPLAFPDIVIEHDAAGRPGVRLPGELPSRFAISLSISHSAAYAVASAITWRR